MSDPSHRWIDAAAAGPYNRRMYKLHSFCQSGNCYKVALMLDVLGQRWEPVFVDFFGGQTRSYSAYRGQTGLNFGPITLTTALTNSVNTAWANVAEDLGAGTIQKYMDRLGFGVDPPLDYPEGQLTPSGVFDVDKDEFIDVDSGRVDIGRVAIGQERLLVSPLQMGLVAAAVAGVVVAVPVPAAVSRVSLLHAPAVISVSAQAVASRLSGQANFAELLHLLLSADVPLGEAREGRQSESGDQDRAGARERHRSPRDRAGWTMLRRPAFGNSADTVLTG